MKNHGPPLRGASAATTTKPEFPIFPFTLVLLIRPLPVTVTAAVDQEAAPGFAAANHAKQSLNARADSRAVT